VALSMDEQRILDEMERNLAADDPRLAARLGSFGQPRLPTAMRAQHVRTIGGVLALALIAAVTIMVFVISPFAKHMQNGPAPTRSTASSAPTTARNSQPTAATSNARNKAPASTDNTKAQVTTKPAVKTSAKPAKTSASRSS
jgi:cytoskeletal protein RodZ